MKVAIVGGAGRMGVWFASYFRERGYEVSISDIRLDEARAIAESIGVDMVEENHDVVRDADLVLLSIPIRGIPEVIGEVAPYLKDGAILMDIASLKSDSVDALRKIKQEIRPVSVHPLFGPSAEGIEGATIVVIPVADPGSEAEVANRVFRGAKIVVCQADGHDRAMATVLGLSYFLNLSFVGALEGEDLSLLKELSGTTFTVQYALAQSVVNEDPWLIRSLLSENEFFKDKLDGFLSHAKRLREMILEEPNSFTARIEGMKEFMREDPDYLKADELRLRVFKAIDAFRAS
jgi:prephenate dehydrogenase